MAFLVGFENLSADIGGVAIGVVENDLRADAGAFGRAQHRPPIIAGILLQQQNFKLAAGTRIPAAQPRRNDARVIQHQQVPRAE